MQVEPEVLLAAQFSARTDFKQHKFYCYILLTRGLEDTREI